MRRTLLTLGLLVAAVIITPSASVSAQSKMPDAVRMDVVVHHVPPAYPYEARQRRITGQGIMFGEVDSKTGIVKSVKMEKSTGSRILDQAALSAFRQWRFKPGTVRQFRMPITYTMAN